MEKLKANLDKLIDKLDNPSDFGESLESLISVYPFNEYEYIISTLLGTGILTRDDYYELRDEYIARNMYLIWAILNRSLEINENGIDYKEASRRVSLNWSEIEAIKREKYKGQITFWVSDKKVRIHTYGLNRQAQREVHKALSTQIKAQNIQVR